MIFSSIQYLLFLPVVAILYWRTRGTARLALVVAASYFFYMSWLPIYGILLFTLTCANWALGLAIEAARSRGKNFLLKPLLSLGLLGNLGCLCYYKYANFFLSNIVQGLHWLTSKVSPTSAPLVGDYVLLNILLPLGISFFVFEFVHYIVDVYKGDKPVKSWLEFMAFASFFPSQIAGPIKRYQEFIDSLRKPLPFDSALLSEGGALIMQGLFKKVAIADPISGVIYGAFLASHPLSCTEALMASVGFWIQVYCDFSGYTDIGRGSALLLGIRLPENFNLPYLATDIGDFWRRWHMSLSFWLRDYVYIPLGGSRKGRINNWQSLFFTMVACGLWHGAAWHYVIFGCLQGAAMIVNREYRLFLKSARSVAAVVETPIARFFGVIATTIFIIATYTVFRAPDMGMAMNVLGSWFSPDTTCTFWTPLLKSGVLCMLVVYMGFWLFTEALKRFVFGKPFASHFGVYPSAVRFASWTAAVILIVAARPTVATPFVYFQF